MPMKGKPKKAVLAAACICAAIVCNVIAPATAYARWSLMQAISLQLAFSANKANASAIVYGMPAVTSIKAEFWLCEKDASGYYVKVYSWPEQKAAGRVLSFTGQAPATPGKVYRLYTKATASDAYGATETVTDYVQSTY